MADFGEGQPIRIGIVDDEYHLGKMMYELPEVWSMFGVEVVEDATATTEEEAELLRQRILSGEVVIDALLVDKKNGHQINGWTPFAELSKNTLTIPVIGISSEDPAEQTTKEHIVATDCFKRKQELADFEQLPFLKGAIQACIDAKKRQQA